MSSYYYKYVRTNKIINEKPKKVGKIRREFDDTDISDLPLDLRENLKVGQPGKYKYQKVIGLFDIKEELTSREIVIGMYRVHKIIMKKANVAIVLRNCVKLGFLKLSSPEAVKKTTKKVRLVEKKTKIKERRKVVKKKEIKRKGK